MREISRAERPRLKDPALENPLLEGPVLEDPALEPKAQTLDDPRRSYQPRGESTATSINRDQAVRRRGESRAGQIRDGTDQRRGSSRTASAANDGKPQNQSDAVNPETSSVRPSTPARESRSTPNGSREYEQNASAAPMARQKATNRNAAERTAQAE